jgi:cytochrome c-type biogenesis protein CcmH
VTLTFVLLAALMLAVALAVVLRPLLRGRSVPAATAARRRMHALQEAHATGVLSDAEYAAKRAELGEAPPADIDAQPARSRSAFAAAVAIAFVLPVAAILLYRQVGDPRALDPASIRPAPAQAGAEHGGQDMDQAIAGLAEKLKQTPDDVQGWALLGRAYLETQHFAEARDALEHAHDLAPDDSDISVAYAEAMTLSSQTHRLEGQARELVEAALKKDPDNQRGIWLIGIAEYQNGQFDKAIAQWNRLLTLLPADSSIMQSVKAQIARAEAERDGREPPAATDTASPTAQAATAAPAAQAATPTAASGATLTVQVSLDPKLAASVAPGDTLYVYAKAAQGPPMPLAISRMQASQLPATVVLTDGMGMLPNMKLSQFPQVIVGARISKSGNALAQSGDLQSVSKPLPVTTSTPIPLTIDQVVP